MVRRVRAEKLEKAGLFVRMASRPIPRVSRMMLVARELGWQCVFVGAYRDRDVGRDDSWEGYRVRRVGGFFPLLNGRRPLFYLWSVLRFWFGVISELVKQRPAFVHASDFEAGVPCVVFCGIARCPLIYNVHDNLASRYVLPSGVATILNVCEGLMAKMADVTLVPEDFRSELLPRWSRGNVAVIRNTPVDPTASPPPAFERQSRIMFAGWLDKGRGLWQLIELAERQEIELVVAGEGDAEIVARVKSAQGVKYIGFQPHERVIKETANCHFVAAFYDPQRPINRYAASNKVAEALSLGRPVLINVETLIAADLKAAGCAVVIPYRAIPDLPGAISHLLSVDGEYARMCVRARVHYEREYDWKVVRLAIVGVYSKIGVRS